MTSHGRKNNSDEEDYSRYKTQSLKKPHNTIAGLEYIHEIKG